MNKSKTLTKSYTGHFLVLGVLLLVMGCAMGSTAVYEADYNAAKQPQMSFPQAYEKVIRGFQESDSVKTETNDVHVTSKGISFISVGVKYSGQFDEIQIMTVNTGSGGYYVDWDPNNGPTAWHLYWQSQSDAQNFVDAVMAMKYYATKNLLDDDTSSFAEFQDKANVWRALTQKPPLSEEARRFRVLADDAVQNKDFDKAADYYEQGLAIDPMWPAGQFNAAIIYAELKFYPMAVMHMKRYLALEPDAKDAKIYQDKIYIWEEKAEEGNASSDDLNTQAAANK
jgi:tetratricopeptide (TPR) repeat protein